MKVKNKLLVVALAIVAALCMASTAFATTISASPVSVKAGDTVTVAVSIEEDMTNVLTCAYDVYFDDQNFEYMGGSIGNASSLTQISDLKMDGGAHLSVSVLDTASNGVEVKAGTLCTLTFKAKDGINDPAAFTLQREGFLFADFTDHAEEGTVSAGSVSVTVSSDSDEDSGDNQGGDEGDGSDGTQDGSGDEGDGSDGTQGGDEGDGSEGTQDGTGDEGTGNEGDSSDDTQSGVTDGDESDSATDGDKSDSSAADSSKSDSSASSKSNLSQTGDATMAVAAGLSCLALIAAAGVVVARKKGLIG